MPTRSSTCASSRPRTSARPRVKELTGGWGADVVVDVAGFPQVVAEGMKMMAQGARYVEIGNISPGLTYDADPSFWVTNNCTITGIHVYEPRHLREALRLLDRKATSTRSTRSSRTGSRWTEVNEVLAPAGQGRHHPLQPGAVRGPSPNPSPVRGGGERGM